MRTLSASRKIVTAHSDSTFGDPEKTLNSVKTQSEIRFQKTVFFGTLAQRKVKKCILKMTMQNQ